MEEEKVLIAKKKSDGLSIKVRTRISKGYVPDDYVKVLNPQDLNDLALFFEDLSLLVDAPIEKAFFKYKERKKEEYPFF